MNIKTLSCSLVFVIAATPIQVLTANTDHRFDAKPMRALADTGLYYPQLSYSFLLEQPDRSARPAVYVSRFSIGDGLFIGYQARGGKRLLLWSSHRTDGTLAARVFHLNPDTGKIQQIMNTAPSDPADAAANMTVWIEQTNLQQVLEVKRIHRGVTSDGERRLKGFMRSDAGIALLQAIPALYATLEQTDEYAMGGAGLLTAFGIVRMALEASTGNFAGFDDADEVLGLERAREMRTRCVDKRCQYQGRTFTIRESGMFDMLSDQDSNRRGRGAGACRASNHLLDGLQPDFQITPVQFSDPDGGNSCFGMCGPGCLTPIPYVQVYTYECTGHDGCVDQHGHLDCMFSTPSNCQADPCNSLVDAILSFIVGVFGGGSGGGGSGGGGYAYWPSGEYYTPSMVGMPFCTLDIYCIDEPGGPPPGELDPY